MGSSQLLAMLLGFVLLCVAFVTVPGSNISPSAYQENAEIHGYHFHTYFFQNNEENTLEALTFR